MPINRSECEFCIYHAQTALRRLSLNGGRPELQAGGRSYTTKAMAQVAMRGEDSTHTRALAPLGSSRHPGCQPDDREANARPLLLTADSPFSPVAPLQAQTSCVPHPSRSRPSGRGRRLGSGTGCISGLTAAERQ